MSPLFIILSGFGIMLFIFIAFALPFKNHLLSLLYPKSLSRASTNSVSGLQVHGNELVNDQGQRVILHGVDRSGSEYMCLSGNNVFDGPVDDNSVIAMVNWKVNVVRVPLNEDCWLGINGVKTTSSAYQQAVISYVNLLMSHNLAVILDLHWAAPGSQLANAQLQMPDEDHAPTFWSSVANTFKGDSAVIFDLFNEPFPDNNSDSTAGWVCLRDGGSCSNLPYQAAGMQQLVNTIRATGATNVIMSGGIGYAGLLDQWLSYKPTDPLNNIVAAWHSYNFSWCTTLSCWDTQLGPVAAQVPVVAGEIGENDCTHGYIDNLMNWLDSHNASYLAWGWDTYDCKGFPSLIADYTGTPTQTFGQGYENHLLSLAMATPSPVTTETPAPTPTTSPQASPTPAPEFSGQSSVTPNPVLAGNNLTINTSLTANAAVTALVDIEVYNSSNTKVYQNFFDNQSFSALATKTYTSEWSIPASIPSGNYKVAVGVFNPGWIGTLYWNGSSSELVINTPTPLPSPSFPPTPMVTPSPTSQTTPLAGDLNGDSRVNLTDLSILATNYGLSGTSILNPAADINQDGIVNLTDLSLLAAHYGL